MLEYFTLDYLLLWTVFSCFVFVFWGASINDPGSTSTGNSIFTTICAIMALPLTIIITVFFIIVYFLFKPKTIKKNYKTFNKKI